MDFTTQMYRSRLSIPANVEKFIEKAYTRNADVIVLDLEDSIPIKEKESARKTIRPSIAKVNQGGSLVYVRINAEQEMVFKDIFNSIWLGIDGIVFPKVEFPEQIVEIDNWVTVLENERGLQVGSVKISLVVETSTGIKNLESILASSKRIDTVTLGTEDFTNDINMTVSEQTNHYLDYFRMLIVNLANAYNVVPMGLVQSMTNYQNLEYFQEIAETSHQVGFQGSTCIHPAQVEILNHSFSPSETQVQHAKNIIEAFEKALQNNRASASLEGKMIDYPHYYQAQKVLQRFEAIKSFEETKAQKRKEGMRNGE